MLCHQPPGNGEPVTLEVDASAVAAHLAHGDVLGECPGSEPTATTEPGPADDEVGTLGGPPKGKPPPIVPPPEKPLFVDPCKFQNAADATEFVPQFLGDPAFKSELVSSGAAYAYRTVNTGVKLKCNFFVTDWVVNVLSNNPDSPPGDPDKPSKGVLFLYDFQDLPSSATQGGRLPAIQRDCETYFLKVLYYSTDFPLQKTLEFRNFAVFKGSWDGTQCQRVRTEGTLNAFSTFVVEPELAPGFDVHRFAVAGSLRGTFQRVSLRRLPGEAK